VFAVLLKLWRRIPESVRERIYRVLAWTGLPYSVSFVVRYSDSHKLPHFAGHLVSLKQDFARSTGEHKKALTGQFDGIIDNLVMKNGVRKTTYSARHASIMVSVLGGEPCRINKSEIRVLDVPSSTGISSLASLEMLGRFYTVSAYVLGDLFFRIGYDRHRGCVYDDAGDLLQVKLKKQFFAIYRPHVSGNVYNPVADLLLLPFNVRSWYLKRKYRCKDPASLEPILLIHPDVEARLGDGVLSTREMDVFKAIEDNFDVIISFNLLQKNYFPPALIEAGKENLKYALNEGGLLIMGNTESFSVSRKIDGELVVVERTGDF